MPHRRCRPRPKAQADPAVALTRLPFPRTLYRLSRGWMGIAKPFRLGVRTLMFDGEGAVCLVRHTYRPGWYLPGGGVKRWETTADAAIRETEEEAGVRVDRLGRLIHLYANFQVGYCDHVALYLVDAWRPAEHRSLEIAEVGFFGLDALPPDTTRPTLRRLEEWRGAADLSEHW